MASPPTKPNSNEWLVIIPDRDGVTQKRMEVRNEHISNAKKNFSEGIWQLGGALLEKQPIEGESPVLKGTTLLLYADSREAVIKQLEKDVYSTHGVWDWSKVQIFPFKTALTKWT